MTTALKGLKVLDFTQMMAGPVGTMMLGDLGADVLKVEQPEGDPFRKSGETTLGGDGVFFLSMNRNKRGIVLDLKTEAGCNAVRALVREADVVVENFRPGFMDKAGLGYDDLKKINPRLIYSSVTGFGRTGPDAGRPALDQVIQAMSGLMQVTGTPESGPLKIGFPYCDLVSGLIAMIGVLAAVEARHRTGEGQRVDVSMMDASMFSHAPRDVYFDATGKCPPLTGNEHWDIVPNNTYPTSDGREMMVITINDKFWQVLCDGLGVPALKTDPRFAKKAERLANRALVDSTLREVFATRTLAEWNEALLKAGAIFGPVRTWQEAFNDPQITDHLIKTIHHPKAGSFKVVANPIQLSGTPAVIERAPPMLGQHNAEVLTPQGVAWPRN